MAALVLSAGCTGDSGGDPTASPNTVQRAASTEEAAAPTATDTETTTESEPEPTVLTHGAFIKQLDRLCRKGNNSKAANAAERNFNAASAANDYEGVAAALADKKYAREDKRFEKKAYALLAPPEDERAFRRYIVLSEQLDNLYIRLIRALRAHDDDEITRLGALVDKIRNKRTTVTSGVGLVECGS
jgi:hypothetical protein